jgi:predicted dehydrogenase
MDRDDSPLVVAYPQATLSEYALEIEAFADYVSNDCVGPTTGRSERRTLSVVQAGYLSAQSGQPVNLKNRFGDL